ncbi:MAG: hypothetical protein IJY66_07270 [Clostridia bacterium]|nr:hypothetical protein [Clostridia bacterium]
MEKVSLDPSKTFEKLFAKVFASSAVPRRLQRPCGAPTPQVQCEKLLSVENPAVFAVPFEAAKARSALGKNRVRLSKNADAFLCVAREAAGIHKGRQSLMRAFWFIVGARQK